LRNSEHSALVSFPDSLLRIRTLDPVDPAVTAKNVRKVLYRPRSILDDEVRFWTIIAVRDLAIVEPQLERFERLWAFVFDWAKNSTFDQTDHIFPDLIELLPTNFASQFAAEMLKQCRHRYRVKRISDLLLGATNPLSRSSTEIHHLKKLVLSLIGDHDSGPKWRSKILNLIRTQQP